LASEKDKAQVRLSTINMTYLSTNYAIISLTEIILETLDNHEFAIGAFIALQKVSDTV